MTMGDSAFDRLNFDHYGRLLSRAAGESYRLAVCDPRGQTLWSSDAAAAERVAQVLGGIGDVGSVAEAPGLALEKGFDPGDGRGRVYFEPIDSRGGEQVGWLVALETEDLHALEAGAGGELVLALKDAAHGIRREYDLNLELNGMAEELSARYEELHLVYGLGTMSRTSQWANQGIFEHLLEPCTRFMDVDLAVFFQPDQRRLVYTANSKGRIVDVDLTLTRVRSDISHYVLSSREAVVVNGSSDPRRGYLCQGMDHKILGAPVFVGDKVRAVLVMLRAKGADDFSNGDRKLMQVLTEQIGSLIHGQDMYTEMRTFTEQVVSALVETVDAKDPYTRGHSERVNLHAMEIGQHMRLAEQRLRDLYWASLLHDLGKIGVPDVLLSKPACLDSDEFILIKMHPLRGNEILNHVERLKSALPGILHHHEKFDGSGYPYGLSGVDIPLHARIIAVADTYDAMTSSRAYRASLSHQEAMAEIRRVAGTQLDPEIVEVWTQVVSTNPERYCREKGPI